MTTAQVQVQLVSVFIFKLCMMSMIMFATCSLHSLDCPEKQEVPGERQKAALLLRVQ